VLQPRPERGGCFLLPHTVRLRFGDFTGDGVTDVLAVVNGHWAISESATGQWRTLNSSLGDPVENLFIANMDADDNIDDILKFERQCEQKPFLPMRCTLTWWRSKNGTGPWLKWQSYTTPYYFADDEEYVRVFYGFAGRFAAVPGNGTRVMDSKRVGGGTMLTDERRVGSLLQSSGEAKRQAGGLGE